MSTQQPHTQATNTTKTTTFNDGSQFKTTNMEYTKKTNLATEPSEKPEFEYNRPAPTSLHTTGVSTGASAIHETQPASGPTTTTYTTTTTHPTSHPSTTDQFKQKMTDLGNTIGTAVTNVSQQINSAISSHHNQPTGTTTANTTQYNTAPAGSEYNPNAAYATTQPTYNTTTQQQHGGGLGSKLNDMMAHVGAALHQGHPVHAVSNASTAVKIGECERVKHERGPLADESAGTSKSNTLDNPNFNAAGQPYDNKSSAAFHQPAGATTFNQSTAYGNQSTLGQPSDHLGYTTGDKMKDMKSHASAQLSHGNPISAITDAPAAARIAETEKLKHERGPINDSAPIQNASQGTTYHQTAGQSIPSGTGQGNFGGVTGISGQGGASSTLSHDQLTKQRQY